MKDEIKEILKKPNVYSFNDECYLYFGDYNKLKDYITNLQDTLKDREEYCYGLETQLTNLQEKVNMYENPDDMTLFYMWLDEKAKDKIKQLQEENEKLKDKLDIFILSDKTKQETIDRLRKTIDELKEGK